MLFLTWIFYNGLVLLIRFSLAAAFLHKLSISINSIPINIIWYDARLS